jgi:hypothetical protein
LKLIKTLTTVCILTLVVGGAHASTVTFDFEDGLSEKDGFRFTVITYEGVTGGASFSGTANFFNVDIELERIDGGLFALESFDSAPIIYGFGLCANTGAIGVTSSGGAINAPTSGGFCNDSDWETPILSPEWASLRSVTFATILVDNTYSQGQIDNVVVSNVIPIPAAVWLFGSALAGLGWLRRKQSV